LFVIISKQTKKSLLIFTDLKPDAGFTPKDVENAIQSLENSDFLITN